MNEDQKQLGTETFEDEPDQVELNFRYIKSNHFRVIHADGALGGVTPRGNIHFSLYSERPALPDSSKLIISNETGLVLKPEEYQGSGKIARELEVDVVIDLPTAMQIRGWLHAKINELQALIKESQNEEVSDDNKKASA